MNCRLQRQIQNSVKNLRWSALQEYLTAFNDFQLLTIFAKHSILDVWQGSEYASGLLKLFCPGFKKDTREYLLYIKLIIVFTQHFSLILKSYSTWKYNIQANESITKIKEKWTIIQFDAFVLCFIFFIAMPQTISVIDRSGMCHFLHIKLVAHVLVCAHAIACINGEHWCRRWYTRESIITNNLHDKTTW